MGGASTKVGLPPNGAGPMLQPYNIVRIRQSTMRRELPF
jgi:hypothetical protein